MEDRVPEHEVEALVSERQRLGVCAGGPHIEAEPGRVGREGADHPR